MILIMMILQNVFLANTLVKIAKLQPPHVNLVKVIYPIETTMLPVPVQTITMTKKPPLAYMTVHNAPKDLPYVPTKILVLNVTEPIERVTP